LIDPDGLVKENVVELKLQDRYVFCLSTRLQLLNKLDKIRKRRMTRDNTVGDEEEVDDVRSREVGPSVVGKDKKRQKRKSS
jgi:hypothetical protein